jgi:hypothetical protein
VLVRGRYSGVLEPDRHYLPLERDFSNLDALLDRLHDVEMLQATADRAYEEIFLAGKCRMESFSRALLDAMTRERPHSLRRASSPAITAFGQAFDSISPRGRKNFRRRFARAREALRALMFHRTLLRTLVSAATTGRLRPAESRLLLKDLLRLSAMERFAAAQRRSGGRWRIRASVSDHTLFLRSESGENETPSENMRNRVIEHVIWDHSAVGDSVPISPGNPWLGHAFLGADGRYEFTALERLGARGVPVLWDRLLQAYV